MRKVLALAGLSLVTVLGIPAHAGAAPVLYDIEFTLGPVGDWGHVSGSFAYDSDNPEFSDFHVTWGPQFFDFTDSANEASFGSSLPGCTQGPSCAFAFLTDSIAEAHENVWTALQTSHGYRFSFFQEFFDSSTTASLEVSGLYDTPQWGNSVNTGSGSWSVTPAAVVGTSSIVPSTPVPEPGTLGLVMLGILGAAGRRLRRQA